MTGGPPFPVARGLQAPPLTGWPLSLPNSTRMSLTSTQAFYLLVNNRGLPSLSTTLGEVYRDSQDDDGFLYMTYASQDMFGASAAVQP